MAKPSLGALKHEDDRGRGGGKECCTHLGLGLWRPPGLSSTAGIQSCTHKDHCGRSSFQPSGTVGCHEGKTSGQRPV